MRRTVRLAAVLGLAGMAVSGVTACQLASSAAPTWYPCQGNGLDPRQECATLSVPLDYDKPDGERISIAVSRIRSAHPEHRRGVLFLVPGGPGSGGLGLPSTWGARLPESVRDEYDLIGFDPRGLGASVEANCHVPKEDLVLERLRPWPDADGGIAGNVEVENRVAAACIRNGGALVRSIGTRTEARDIDRIRESLGENKIAAWGQSYGTYVVSVYATMFADRTDRVLLDSNDDPDPDLIERGWAANYAVAMEDRFPDFARWASSDGNPDRVAETPDAVREEFLTVAARLDRAPLPWPGAELSALSGNGLRQTMLDGLHSDKQFPFLAQLLNAAAGSGTLPAAPPAAPEQTVQRSTAVLIATLCNDVAWPTSVGDYTAAVAADRARFPLTAGMPRGYSPCATWPYPVAPRTLVNSSGPSNVLLVQNLRDPASPYSGALNLRRAFGDRARMVAVDAGGHGAYPSPVACANEAVERFLRDGTRPETDLTCR
ncbi:alpha/beta fold hydrolase [Nocardia sp. ET3-3]|uniref:Alpha/beta fold hydrolase n=1 Tax=Nocardia terrae TaxID=2675851 RepID=A0A7K1VB49_9NOCA|nr:alpha/beta hydrolase [Nocardia terrae]MVU83884.1 alpha/beta fold hydrolase [Nocardia terrae]